jgi:hypothetical protein
MKLALFLCCLSSFFCDYQDVNVTINIPEEVQNDEIVMLSGTIYNGSAKNIAFWNIELFKSLYRGDMHWHIIILKEGQQFFIPKVLFNRILPTKVIKLKKNEKYVFEIPISFRELSIDGFLPLDSIESGDYEIQLIVSLKKPQKTAIRSNTVKFYLNVNPSSPVERNLR